MSIENGNRESNEPELDPTLILPESDTKEASEKGIDGKFQKVKSLKKLCELLEEKKQIMSDKGDFIEVDEVIENIKGLKTLYKTSFEKDPHFSLREDFPVFRGVPEAGGLRKKVIELLEGLRYK